MRYQVEREGTLTPRVGYTYFGQFVGHDLSHDMTILAEAGRRSDAVLSYQTPFLDLSNLYAGGPTRSPELYEGEPGAEQFKIGSTTPGAFKRDLPIQNGRILIDQYDRRNLDNIVLRQLHILFLKFHNRVINLLNTSNHVGKCAELHGRTLFEQAQRLVRWHYQWLVRHDFLPRILHPSMWSRGGLSPKKATTRAPFSIPVEFSMAAYRFGHSMVRNAYALNCRRKHVELAELMARGEMPAPLHDDLLIEWGRFFDGLPTSGPVASSSFIDTSIAAPLHSLPGGTLRLSNPNDRATEPASLPVRTLLRGERARLPSGQEVTNELLREGRIRTQDCLSVDELTRDTSNGSGTVLLRTGLATNAPLFYYILKEAELRGRGETLGPVGSQIVAEVIGGALAFDPDGYIAINGPDWKPPPWVFPNGYERPITSLAHMIQLTGDTQLLPECDAHWRKFLP